MWRRLHTVRPAPAPWRDSHVNIYHDYYYYFNPPKSYPPTPPPSRAFKFPLTLLFTSTALQLGFRRGCDLLKLRFIFFPFEGKKRKEKKFSRLCPQREGLWSRAFCSKKFSLFASSTELRVSFTSPTSFFFSQCAPTDMREDFTRKQEVCDSPRWLEECELSFENDISPL